MNIDDYKFVYKPSISIIMRELALDLRIAALLSIKFARHRSGRLVGVHNNLHELIGLERHEIENIYNVMGVPRHMMDEAYRKVGNYKEMQIHINEARFISSDALRRIIGRPNRKKTYGYWLYKPTIWQRIKLFFRS